jgi:hypothetical protein
VQLAPGFGGVAARAGRELRHRARDRAQLTRFMDVSLGMYFQKRKNLKINLSLMARK